LPLFDKLLDKKLELRARVFNLLGMAGMLISLIVTLSNAIIGAGATNIALSLASSLFAALMLYYANRSGRFHRCFVITIVIVFMIAFPVMFFTAGGYHSGMPSFFVFAVVFTAFMLDGVKSFAMVAFEMLLYSGICLFAYFRPESVSFFESEFSVAADTIIGFWVVSLAIVLTVTLVFQMYGEQQRMLSEKNAALEQLDRLKTEFFQNMNHDMKTPLTVISTFIGNADDMLDHGVDTSEVKECLERAGEQIQNLARMVEHSLSAAAAQEGKWHMEPFDFAALLRSCAGAFSLTLKESGSALSVQIPNGLPKITGSKDTLERVINNLLSNAGRHTANGKISVSLNREGGKLITTVTDTGEGIDPAMLSRIFERGVSGRGTTGYGLSICKTIIETHGGEITIHSSQCTMKIAGMEQL
jgi:signal transduction histidine kinase